jgi:hypothetical protein
VGYYNGNGAGLEEPHHSLPKPILFTAVKLSNQKNTKKKNLLDNLIIVDYYYQEL